MHCLMNMEIKILYSIYQSTMVSLLSDITEPWYRHFLFGNLLSYSDFSVLAFLCYWNLLRCIHMDESSLWIIQSAITINKMLKVFLLCSICVFSSSLCLHELKVRPALVSFICALTMASWEEWLCLFSFTDHFLQTPNSFTTFNDHQLLAHLPFKQLLTTKQTKK